MYGSADMAYSMFAVGLLDELNDTSREAWAQEIQQFQDPKTGRFAATPGPGAQQPWHALAEATEALYLLGASPKWPMQDLQDLAANKSAIRKFLDDLVLRPRDGWWTSASVQAPPGIVRMAGLHGERYAALVEEWFQELDALVDPGTGLWFPLAGDPRLPGSTAYEDLPPSSALFASFHMLHVYACFGRAWKFPRRLVDATLQLQRRWDGLWLPMPSTCADLDGIYVAIHASLQSDRYRWSDVREMCRAYLRTASYFLNDEEWVLGDYVKLEGTHLLHGPLFAVAECQQHFPELSIRTRRTWRRNPGACTYA
mmetsp:Transcript_78538/g.254413  ORF Transcript_78538/g.254413 Transcript_78538/m.254413 type:complete len:312 (-) Transcript_78538:134-1069(-)